MKVAVTYENRQIFQHFGHSQEFKIYEVEDKRVVSSKVVGTDGSGHGALAVFLKGQGVDTVICGGIGEKAKAALEQEGIQLYPGASGDVDKAVEDLLQGTLDYNPDTLCRHRQEGKGHEEHHGHHGNHSHQ